MVLLFDKLRSNKIVRTRMRETRKRKKGEWKQKGTKIAERGVGRAREVVGGGGRPWPSPFRLRSSSFYPLGPRPCSPLSSFRPPPRRGLLLLERPRSIPARSVSLRRPAASAAQRERRGRPVRSNPFHRTLLLPLRKLCLIPILIWRD